MKQDKLPRYKGLVNIISSLDGEFCGSVTKMNKKIKMPSRTLFINSHLLFVKYFALDKTLNPIFFKEARRGESIFGAKIEVMKDPIRTLINDGILHLRITNGQTAVDKFVTKEDCIVNTSLLNPFKRFKIKAVKTAKPIRVSA